MAEIDIERRPPRRTGLWLAVILLLLVAAAAAWYWWAGPGMASRESAPDTARYVPALPPAGMVPVVPADTGRTGDTLGGRVPGAGG